jgi:hypothetical protein
VAASETFVSVNLRHSVMEVYMRAAIQSVFLLGRRSLATLRRRIAGEDQRQSDRQHDGITAWHFF